MPNENDEIVQLLRDIRDNQKVMIDRLQEQSTKAERFLREIRINGIQIGMLIGLLAVWFVVSEIVRSK